MQQSICKLSEWLLTKFQFLSSEASAQPHYLFVKKMVCKNLSFFQDKNKQFVIAALNLLRSLQSVVHSDARKDFILLYNSSPYETGATHSTKMTAEHMIVLCLEPSSAKRRYISLANKSWMKLSGKKDGSLLLIYLPLHCMYRSENVRDSLCNGCKKTHLMSRQVIIIFFDCYFYK